MPTKTIKVAAVQMQCEAGAVDANLAQAAGLVEAAANQGARLVLLPELTPGGYLLTEQIWDSADPFNGCAVAWLKSTACRLGVYLGMSFVEAEGDDFYNSFALATPGGEIAGRVRKNPPASVEAYFFRAGNDRHYIDTELGRIGVGICYENLLHERIVELHAASVDLVLQPSSAATPTATFPIRKRDGETFERMLAGIPAHYARTLGVPVVFANKCGPLVSPLPGGFPAQRTHFPGLSAIADADGSLACQLGSEPGIAVAEVTLDPARKLQAAPRAHGRWALPVPWYAFLWPLTQRLGESSYRKCSRRAQVARQAVPAPPAAEVAHGACTDWPAVNKK